MTTDNITDARLRQEYETGASLNAVAERFGLSWYGAKSAVIRAGGSLRVTDSKRKRIVNADGEIRCRVCGTFKPPEEMKLYSPPHSMSGKPSTLCRRCHNRSPRKREYRNSPENRERERRRAYAAYRAMRDLVDLHPAEYAALTQKHFNASTELEVAQYLKIREHERAVYREVGS